MKTLSEVRRGIVTRALAFAAVGALYGRRAAAAAPAKHRVVFQVSDADPQKWHLTLNNIRNAQKDLGVNNVAIEVVVFGPGIGMLQDDSEVANRVGEALRGGVAMIACENTMHSQKLAREDMIGNVSFVTAGVATLIKRQAEGYAYIRS